MHLGEAGAVALYPAHGSILPWAGISCKVQHCNVAFVVLSLDVLTSTVLRPHQYTCQYWVLHAVCPAA